MYLYFFLYSLHPHLINVADPLSIYNTNKRKRISNNGTENTHIISRTAKT